MFIFYIGTFESRWFFKLDRIREELKSLIEKMDHLVKIVTNEMTYFILFVVYKGGRLLSGFKKSCKSGFT